MADQQEYLDRIRAAAERWLSKQERDRLRELGYDKPEPRKRQTEIPSEHQEQVAFCKWLNHYRIHHFSVPNGGNRSSRSGQSSVARGEKAGVPDLIITSPVPSKPTARVAVEMKRTDRRNQKDGGLSELQVYWKEVLERDGWIVLVGYGCDDAIKQMEELGYGNRSR